jgi:hypothetical protein
MILSSEKQRDAYKEFSKHGENRYPVESKRIRAFYNECADVVNFIWNCSNGCSIYFTMTDWGDQRVIQPTSITGGN